MVAIHVRINDAATGKPTPCRVRFLDGQGLSHAPLGRLADFSIAFGEQVGGSVRLGSENWHFIDGACEVRLPAGPITVEACKGPEYAPLRRTVNLVPGKLAIRLALERWTNWRAQGWYSGDTRAHFLSPPAALLEAAAEDLAVVNVLAREIAGDGNRPSALPDLLAFSGQHPALAWPGHLVVVNTLNTHPMLGTVGLLNCHRPVYPLRFGAPISPDSWSVADWCDQCHRKKGLVTWPDFPRLTADSLQGEALAALLLGKIDAFEVSSFHGTEPSVLADYYRLLDCGLRLPLVGGSGKDRNSIALGSVRTYAQLKIEEEFTFSAWIEAVRAGRTFATNGPLLKFTVDGEGAGSVIKAGDSGKTVHVKVEVQSTVPFDQVEVLGNGNLLASKTASGNRQATTLEADIPSTAATWLTARCMGKHFLPTGESGQVVFAHSSPVYMQFEGSSLIPDSTTSPTLETCLTQTRAWLQSSACCETESQRQHLIEILGAGLLDLRRRQKSGNRGC